MELQENVLIKGRYRLLEERGRGSFGEVWRARDEVTEAEVAVKIYIALDKQGLKEFTEEFRVANALNHPNLLHADYYDIYENRPFIVMPYCPQSTVSLVGKMDEGKAWKFLREVSSGLSYFHGKDIVHRDIKPDNIMQDREGNFLISDFGISTRMRSTLRRNSTREMSQKDIAGTIGYMAPELFSKKPEAVKATDIWAMGASLYELLSGELPFMGQGGVMQLHGAEAPELEGTYSKDLQGVLESCLARDTWERPTAEQLQSYAEAKLRGETPARPWESGGVSEKREGQNETLKPEQGEAGKPKGNQTVAISQENVGNLKKAEGGSGTREEGRKKKSGWIWGVALLAAFAAGILLWQSNQGQARQEEQERIALAEKARQDSLANALAEAQRKAKEAEESYRKAEQEQGEARKQRESEVKAEQERLAQQERQRQEEARKQRESEAKAEQERLAQQERQRQEEARKQQESEAKAEQERLAQQEQQRQEEARKQREAEARRRATSNQIIQVGNVEFEMVYVEGGMFRMGGTSEQGSDAYDNERPVHSVTLSGFHIGKYEVTQGLWREVMSENPSYNKSRDDYPVENVSWEDCQEFIRKLNARTGLTFRLPTEAEWEYAARGGRKSRGYKYSGSNSIGNVAWYDDNSGNHTHPVGEKKPNELGLYDMSGNVDEWCYDWYGDYTAEAQRNPTGPVSGRNRLYRGGSYWFDAWYCRVSYRSGGAPGSRDFNIGLRLVLSL